MIASSKRIKSCIFTIVFVFICIPHAVGAAATSSAQLKITSPKNNITIHFGNFIPIMWTLPTGVSSVHITIEPKDAKLKDSIDKILNPVIATSTNPDSTGYQWIVGQFFPGTYVLKVEGESLGTTSPNVDTKDVTFEGKSVPHIGATSSIVAELVGTTSQRFFTIKGSNFDSLNDYSVLAARYGTDCPLKKTMTEGQMVSFEKTNESYIEAYFSDLTFFEYPHCSYATWIEDSFGNKSNIVAVSVPPSFQSLHTHASTKTPLGTFLTSFILTLFQLVKNLLNPWL